MLINCFRDELATWRGLFHERNSTRTGWAVCSNNTIYTSCFLIAYSIIQKLRNVSHSWSILPIVAFSFFFRRSSLVCRWFCFDFFLPWNTGRKQELTKVFIAAYGVSSTVQQVRPSLSTDGTAEVSVVLEHAILFSASHERLHPLLSILLIILSTFLLPKTLKKIQKNVQILYT